MATISENTTNNSIEKKWFRKRKNIYNWKDAILNECNILFLKYQNYITFVNLIIFNKSIQQSKYEINRTFISGKTTQIIDVYFKIWMKL